MHNAYSQYELLSSRLGQLARSIPEMEETTRWYVSKAFAKIQGLIVAQRQEMDLLGYRDK